MLHAPRRSASIDLDPALLRGQPPPRSQAIEFAFTDAKPHLIPVLTRIWSVPDDLPHAAGMGNLSRVKDWFDESGVHSRGNPNSQLIQKPKVRREFLRTPHKSRLK